jgi:hypothetical protein
MSLNFTVQKIEEYIGLPDGHYTAQIDHIEYYQGDYGNYHIVNWKIMRPSEFEGRIHQERFNIEHENDQVRNIAIQNFSKFCVEIGGLKEGDEPKEEDFLYKVALITIRNKIAKDGKKYTNVIKRELVDAKKPGIQQTDLNTLDPVGIAGSGMVTMQASNPPIPLNDEVPF